MSHQPERKEKDCLNCGTTVQGRYCQDCGQENIVVKQGFWSLARHFVFDIFHFDGKFFDTLGKLIFKPGVVAREYSSGKRTKFLDPIRMYLFTSAFFFLVFFSFAKPEIDIKDSGGNNYLSVKKRLALAEELKQDKLGKLVDTATRKKIDLLLDTTKAIKYSDVSITPKFFVGEKSYDSVEEYDSLENLLPKDKRDNWFVKKLTKKGIEVNTKNEGNAKIFTSFWEAFLHRIPYMLFLSLPFFALSLKLVYLRKKDFFYSDHAVFTLYHYIFSFILLLFIFAIDELRDWLHWGIFNFFTGSMVVLWFFYLYRSMRNFYKQRRAKTIFKYFMVNLCGLFIIMLLFFGFIVFSIFQM